MSVGNVHALLTSLKSRLDSSDQRKAAVEESVRELDELLLKHYLVNASDVRFCPDQECRFAGIVQIDGVSERIECSEALQCTKCSRQWRDGL